MNLRVLFFRLAALAFIQAIYTYTEHTVIASIKYIIFILLPKLISRGWARVSDARHPRFACVIAVVSTVCCKLPDGIWSRSHVIPLLTGQRKIIDLEVLKTWNGQSSATRVRLVFVTTVKQLTRAL